jgi:hypothetical protein
MIGLSDDLGRVAHRKRRQTKQVVMLSRAQMLLTGTHHVKQACVSGVPRAQDKPLQRHWDGRSV